MENYKSESLEIVLVDDGDKTSMLWTGKTDEPNPQLSLTPYLNGLVEGLKGSELFIDFKKLEYMNSSTIPPLIQFIKKLETNEVTTTIVYDANSNWQPVSFKALEALALVLNHIAVKAT